MKTEKPDKRRIGRMSRAVMLMAGRKGRRARNSYYFAQHKQRILAAWSRINLEGRHATWSPRNILSSIFVKGDMATLLTVEKAWSNTLQALREGALWRR